MPSISVIVPLYNKEKDVEHTLQSVLLQEHEDFEVIVVNDGSTDNGETIVKGLEDSRIKIFNKQKEGVSVARNYGAERANHEHIAFLDADDYWYPNHLKNLNSLIEKFPEEKWYATAYEKKYDDKTTISMNSKVMDKRDWFGIIENYFKHSTGSSLVWTSAVCFKKTFFNNLNGFHEDITHGEDTDLWIRAAINESLGFCTTVTATHNLGASNRTSQVALTDRNTLNLDRYEDAATGNIHLKKYLDLNRFALALFAKMNGDKFEFQRITKNIDYHNLNKKQRVLLHMSPQVLRKLKSIKSFLNNKGADFSVFK